MPDNRENIFIKMKTFFTFAIQSVVCSAVGKHRRSDLSSLHRLLLVPLNGKKMCKKSRASTQELIYCTNYPKKYTIN